jgi:hypothetical protein
MIDKINQDQEGEQHLPKVSPDIKDEESGRNNDEDGAEPCNPEHPLPVANNIHPVAQPNQDLPEGEGQILKTDHYDPPKAEKTGSAIHLLQAQATS